MKKEHYIKVHIKSESDLPEVNRDYIVHFKSSIGTGVNISLFRFEKFSRDTWINSFDWYLKPAEPAKGLTDEEIEKQYPINPENKILSGKEIHEDYENKLKQEAAKWARSRMQGDFDRTSRLEKDLKDAEAIFEKMELTAFNFEKRIKKLEELISAHKNLLNCFGISKPKNKTNIANLDEAWEGIAELEKELGLT